MKMRYVSTRLFFSLAMLIMVSQVQPAVSDYLPTMTALRGYANRASSLAAQKTSGLALAAGATCLAGLTTAKDASATYAKAAAQAVQAASANAYARCSSHVASASQTLTDKASVQLGSMHEQIAQSSQLAQDYARTTANVALDSARYAGMCLLSASLHAGSFATGARLAQFSEKDMQRIAFATLYAGALRGYVRYLGGSSLSAIAQDTVLHTAEVALGYTTRYFVDLMNGKYQKSDETKNQRPGALTRQPAPRG